MGSQLPEGASATQDAMLHATTLDFLDSSGLLYENDFPALIEEPNGDYVQEALEMRARIIALKLGRESASRAIDLGVADNTSSLRPMSLLAARLMDEVAGKLLKQGQSVATYGLADVLSVRSRSLTDLYYGQYNDRPIVVRAEEGLTAHAAGIVQDVRALARKGNLPEGVELNDGILTRPTTNGQTATMSLLGYTFRHSPDKPESSVVFSEFPSCPSFIAATVLEQVMHASVIVRMVPQTFKKNERSAQALLNLLGVKDLPVISVSMGAMGRINKIMPWSRGNARLAAIREVLGASVGHVE